MIPQRIDMGNPASGPFTRILWITLLKAAYGFRSPAESKLDFRNLTDGPIVSQPADFLPVSTGEPGYQQVRRLSQDRNTPCGQIAASRGRASGKRLILRCDREAGGPASYGLGLPLPVWLGSPEPRPQQEHLMEFGMFHEFPSLPGRSEDEAFDEAMEQVDIDLFH